MDSLARERPIDARLLPPKFAIFVFNALQNDLGGLICAGWRLVAKLQALLVNHFAQLIIAQIHEVGRVISLLMHQPFPKVFYFLLSHIEGIGMT